MAKEITLESLQGELEALKADLKTANDENAGLKVLVEKLKKKIDDKTIKSVEPKKLNVISVEDALKHSEKVKKEKADKEANKRK